MSILTYYTIMNSLDRQSLGICDRRGRDQNRPYSQKNISLATPITTPNHNQ